MTTWTVCPDCGWDFLKHGDTHRWRFKCGRALPQRLGTGPDNDDNRHTGVVVSAKEADAWHEQIRKIMAERHLNFGDAVDWHIAEKAAFTAPDWDAA